MNRRSLFKSITAVIVASSMEVMGWKEASKINPRYIGAECDVKALYHPAILDRLQPIDDKWKSMMEQFEANVIDCWEDRWPDDYKPGSPAWKWTKSGWVKV
jgi:hypothetical protein